MIFFINVTFHKLCNARGNSVLLAILQRYNILASFPSDSRPISHTKSGVVQISWNQRDTEVYSVQTREIPIARNWHVEMSILQLAIPVGHQMHLQNLRGLAPLSRETGTVGGGTPVWKGRRYTSEIWIKLKGDQSMYGTSLFVRFFTPKWYMVPLYWDRQISMSINETVKWWSWRTACLNGLDYLHSGVISSCGTTNDSLMAKKILAFLSWTPEWYQKFVICTANSDDEHPLPFHTWGLMSQVFPYSWLLSQQV